MLVSATEGTLGLNEHDATALIKHAFEQADKDNDKRINIHDYVQLVTSSPNFFESFTINIEQLLAKYNVITAEEVQVCPIQHCISQFYCLLQVMFALFDIYTWYLLLYIDYVHILLI